MTQIALHKRFTGWHMLAIMVGFFAVVFFVNGILVFSALSSWTGLVVENSYVASQTFDTDTERLATARKDLRHQLHYQDGQLKLDLKTLDGLPANATDIKIDIGRPADNSQDQSLTLISEGDGHFFATSKLASGVWTGNIKGRLNGNSDIVLPFRLIIDGNP
ncbi:MAG: FixH family protein [Aestuariivirga sp.]